MNFNKYLTKAFELYNKHIIVFLTLGIGILLFSTLTISVALNQFIDVLESAPTTDGGDVALEEWSEDLLDTFSFAKILVAGFGVVVGAYLNYALFGAVMAIVKNKNAKDSQIWAAAKNPALFIQYIGLNIVLLMMTFFGLLLFILPGIYVMICWGFILWQFFHDQDGIFHAISKGLKNVKKSFGSWLLLIVVLVAIGSVFSLIFSALQDVTSNSFATWAVFAVDAALNVLFLTPVAALATSLFVVDAQKKS